MKILNIAKYDLIKLFREKIALLFVVILPVVFTIVMGLAYGSTGSSEDPKLPVGIVDNDASKLSTELITEVSKDKTIYIKALEGDEIYDQVKSAGIEIGFIIPADFSEKIAAGKAPEIKVVKLPSSADFIAMEGILSSAFSKLRLEESIQAYFDDKFKGYDAAKRDLILSDISKEVGSNLQKPALISVEAKKYAQNVQSSKFDGKTQSSVGMAIMFVMFTIILGAGDILEEKKNNTWGRLSITPTGRSTIILGKIAGTFFKGWVQVAFLMLFGKLVFGVNWGESILSTAIIVSIYILSVTGMGMFLSSLVQTNSQLGAVSAIVIICTSMLSGCYWPVDMVPVFMQKMAMFFPQYWALKGLTVTAAGGLGLSSAVKPVLALTAIAVVFFLLSTIKGRFRVEFRKKPAAGTHAEDAL